MVPPLGYRLLLVHLPLLSNNISSKGSGRGDMSSGDDYDVSRGSAPNQIFTRANIS